MDYWNRLGWVDPFSSENYSSRQNEYAAAFGSENVFTPQVMVNGQNGITGSNENGIRKLKDKRLMKASAGDIRISAKLKDAMHVNIIYDAPLKRGDVINIALVQRYAVTNVRNGENGGRTLKHYNVVRGLATLEKESGSIEVMLPKELSATDCNVIAYMQEYGKQINGATEINITAQ